MTPLHRGQVVWVDLNPGRGSEQAGTRPAVIVASQDYLDNVSALVVVLPVTTRDRGWPHHVKLTGGHRLGRHSFAMTEQPRTVTRNRISRVAGSIDATSQAEIDRWLADFLGLGPRGQTSLR